MELLVLAIPVFVGGVALEAVVTRRFRGVDALVDLSASLLQLCVDLALRGVVVGAYAGMAEAAVLRWPSGWLGAVAGFLAVDLAMYLFHRASHRTNLLWAVHAPHHSCEAFDLAVALRVSALKPVVEIPLFAPLALIGVPFETFVATVALHTLLQFPIHTAAIGKLGLLELVLVTPSHHRVHHGRDPEYLDRNYGGVLIVWDRLFGTFRAEDRPPTYGTVHPLRSRNPLWVQLAPIMEVWRTSRGWSARDRLQVWLRPPGWTPSGPLPASDEPRASAPRPTRAGAAWVAASFVVSAVLIVDASVRGPEVGSVPAVGFAVWGLGSMGGLIERRWWAWPSEVGRLSIGLAGGLALGGPRGLVLAGISAVGLLLAARIQRSAVRSQRSASNAAFR